MSNKYPSPTVDTLHLQFKYVRVGINAAVDPAGFDQFADRIGRAVKHRSSSERGKVDGEESAPAHNHRQE